MMSEIPATVKRARHSFRGALGATVFAMIGGLLVVLAVGLFEHYHGDKPFQPFYGSGYDSPEPVDVAEVVQGGTIHVTATKCYSEPIQIYGQSNWHFLGSPSIPPILHTQPSSVSPKGIGCETKTFQHVIPIDLPPGPWELAGIDTASSDCLNRAPVPTPTIGPGTPTPTPGPSPTPVPRPAGCDAVPNRNGSPPVSHTWNTVQFIVKAAP